MARKPNYGMERRQRERARQEKAQERQRQREAESAGRKAVKPGEEGEAGEPAPEGGVKPDDMPPKE
jgi:hypothetical protein